MVVSFAVILVTVSWVLCNFLIVGVLRHSVERNLEKTFTSCNMLFQDDNKQASDGDLFGQIQNPQDALVTIVDTESGRIYTSINDEGKMMESVRRELKTINELKDNSMLNGTYTIQQNHDEVLNADYVDLLGKLNNGYVVILRTPVARIENTMGVISRVFFYVCIGLLVLGFAFIMLLSNIFAAPIRRLSRAARKMTELDFNVKVPVYSTDEIGDLSSSMNEMSSKLENTISELKVANLKLQKDIEEKQQLNEMRNEFLSHVSHELKTPIALIQGYAEGLKDNIYDDDPESREFYTDVIIDEAQKMNTMVKRLLMLNEIEFGNVPLQIERFELTSFLQQIIASSQILADEKETAIQFQEPEEVYVWADEYMIEEVFRNYLTNAIHYVNQGGKIQVFLQKKEKTVRVNVYNQGPWIEPEDIGRVFEKFYKADKARTREYGGNGIGLSIVAATMQAHNKDYGVENVADGVLFYFELDTNVLDDKAI